MVELLESSWQLGADGAFYIQYMCWRWSMVSTDVDSTWNKSTLTVCTVVWSCTACSLWRVSKYEVSPRGYTAHIYEKCRRPKATKKEKTKTSKISKTSVFHRFFIFEVLVSFPQVEMGRKPKPPISKTSQKPLLKRLSVFDFRFWGRFWRRQFSYMGDDTVEGEGAVTRPIPTQIFLTDPSLNSELPECCWHHECCI